MPITGARVKSRKDQVVHHEDGVTTARRRFVLAEFLLKNLGDLSDRIFGE